MFAELILQRTVDEMADVAPCVDMQLVGVGLICALMVHLVYVCLLLQKSEGVGLDT